MWVPKKRLEDMDVEGIDVAVLFGGGIGIGMSGFKDGKFAAAMMRAYDTWLQEFCSYNPKRLKGVMPVCLQNPEETVAEMHRAVSEFGFVGLCIPPNAGGRNLYEKDFFPIYGEAEKLGVPLCIHMGGPFAPIDGAGLNRFNDRIYKHMVLHAFEQMIAFMTVLGGGILDVYPKSKVAFLEAGVGWVPYWLEKFEEHYEMLGYQVPLMKSKPSEYLESGQVYISCECEEDTLEYVAEKIGDDKILYASDYWHWDGKFPGTVSAIADRPKLPEASKRKILGENAKRFFGLNGT